MSDIRKPFISDFTCTIYGINGEEFMCEPGDLIELVEKCDWRDYFGHTEYKYYNFTKNLYFWTVGRPARKPMSKLLKTLFH